MAVVNHHCAVLGRPIAHSLSPVLHNAAYRALGLDDWSYGRHEVGESDLDGFLASLDPTWAGLSLTMPLKKTIQPYGTPSDMWAERLAVANTVIFDWNRRDGDSPAMRLYNTDVPGIVLAFAHAAGRPAPIATMMSQETAPPAAGTPASPNNTNATGPSGSAVVIGNGNTAMSAVAACTMMTAPAIGHVTVAARHPERNADALRRIAEATGKTLDVVALDAVGSALRQADVVISTLPAHAADPLAEQLAGDAAFTPRGTLLDVVYDPRPTALMTVWSDRGATTIGGQEMLLYQAILQVWLMTGCDSAAVEAIEQPMRQALEEVL